MHIRVIPDAAGAERYCMRMSEYRAWLAAMAIVLATHAELERCP